MRPPQNRNDHIVSKKMIKHIVGMTIWMSLALILFIYFGEYLILEPEENLRFGHDNTCYGNMHCVFPGRPKTW